MKPHYQDKSHYLVLPILLGIFPSLAWAGDDSGLAGDHYLAMLGALGVFAFAFWPRSGQPRAAITGKPFWKTLISSASSSQGENMIAVNPNTTLARLSLPYRVLFTGFLLVIGVGLLMAGAQIMLTHGKADGKPGLSINDIVYSYYGNRSGSKLESMLEGQMKAMAPDEVRFVLIQWARDGAPRDPAGERDRTARAGCGSRSRRCARIPTLPPGGQGPGPSPPGGGGRGD